MSKEENRMENHLNKQNEKDRSLEEAKSEKKSLEEFNSVTQKVKPENQNQTFNVRREGIGNINQKR